MAQLPVDHRTVGVVSRNDTKMCSGYTLFNASRETYLINEDGQMVHQWRSRRQVFISYLLPSGNLLRDGGAALDSPGFQAGGAAGVVEEVTWDNTLVWVYDFYPYQQCLSHHDLEPLPNGHVLVLAWERKTKQQALDACRRPDLIPDGEVWNNLVLELKPEGGSASIVWQWSMWDHIIQDINPSLPNYGNISEHPELFDINFCPVGGKNAQRNRTVLQQGSHENPSGLALFSRDGKTGEKDWLHVNCVSYDRVRDQILLCNHLAAEFIIIDHGTTSEEAKGHSGGKRGKGGDILYRFGNPVVCRQGVLEDQILFCPHSTLFVRDAPGDGNVLLFNNGRAPDRLFSTVEEYELPDQDGNFKYVTQRVAPVWSFGPKQGRLGSFYCTHISGAQRLPNGNTLITMGPQGIVFEVTPAGEEVWRYINPIRVDCAGAVASVRQGDFRTEGRFYIFFANRYPDSYPAFASRSLHAGRHLEEPFLP
eukprot:Skav217908  [mRNA]  locus=scaffold795:191158:192594:+ [translate_table: standard]